MTAYLDVHGGYFSIYTFQNLLSCVKKSNLEDFKIYYQAVYYYKQDSMGVAKGYMYR